MINIDTLKKVGTVFTRKRLILIGIAVGILAVTCGIINITVDPFGVFGDKNFNWYEYNMTNNPKTAKFAYLDKHYNEYNSYIIGSPSASSYSTDVLNNYTNSKFYNLFDYTYDTKYYRDCAEYVIKHYNAENIVLNLDIDNADIYNKIGFGAKNGEYGKFKGNFLPVFYLKYIFANPKYAYNKVHAWYTKTLLPQDFDAFCPETGSFDDRVRDAKKIGDITVYESAYSGNFISGGEKHDLNYIKECVESAEYIKKLCDENDVKLTVILSPVNKNKWEKYDSEKTAKYKNELAKVTDYWDFSYTSVSDDDRYFYDLSRFRNSTGDMVLAKIFNDDTVYYPADFGEYINKGGNVSTDKAENIDKAKYTADVPILMYHHIDEDVKSNMVVSPQMFENQIKALLDAGYHAVSPTDLINYVYHGADLPSKPICITFDDGYYSNYEKALPILQKYNVNATIFIIGAFVGNTEHYKDTSNPITPHFTYEQAKEMMATGLITIQSHTYDMHQWAKYENKGKNKVRENVSKLPNETDEEFEKAINDDFDIMSEKFKNELGQDSIYAMAYPYGKYSTLSEVTLHERGVKMTVLTADNYTNTVVKGLPQSLYALCRYGVYEELTPEKLIELLEKNYKG